MDLSPETQAKLEETVQMKKEVMGVDILSEPDSVAAEVYQINPDEGKVLYEELGRKCRAWTALSHPTKMTVEEFYEELISCKDSFISNMNYLNENKKWAEDWIQTLAAWAEMEKGDWD